MHKPSAVRNPRPLGRGRFKHKIRNAYDAYWFLYYHPKFSVPDRIEVCPDEVMAEDEYVAYTKDRGGKCYRVFKHGYLRALKNNLDIHYALTNKPGGKGTIVEDKSKNKYVECWLEYGPLSYDYTSGGTYDWDVVTHLQHYHDIQLDCGAPTFDEALVILAKKVQRLYGDYREKDE